MRSRSTTFWKGSVATCGFRQPSTLDDLEEYAYYVAGSVGLMLLPLLHVHAPLPQRLREDAVALGVAMQLTNILRDVGDDLVLPSRVSAGGRVGRRRAIRCASWPSIG